LIVQFNRADSHEIVLLGAANDLKQKFDFESSGLAIDEEAVKVSAKLYFSINRAYKAYRMKDGHNTRPAKIAGLTAASFMMVRPIFSTNQSESNELYYANPFLGILCGAGIVNADFNLIEPDTMMRISVWMDQLRLQGARDLVNRIVTCMRAKEFLPLEEAVLVLTPTEVIQLDMFVAIFELIEIKPKATSAT
jgi:hypothetical protein